MNPDTEFPAELEFQPGDVVGERYTLLELLARQDQFTLWRVEDTQSHGAACLKLIHASVVQHRDAIARYRREIHVMRQIVSPGLLRILDFGEYLGRIYLVSEPLNGCTLDDYVKSAKKLSTEQFFTFFFELCDALSELHSRKLIHGDLRPSNITITNPGCLKIMDFRINRELGGSSGPTGDDSAYLPPERLKDNPLTPAADIYSVGALSHLMLTGRSPRNGEGTPQGLPSGLAGWIETCLQSDPGRRFQDIKALREAAATVRESLAAPRENKPEHKLEELKTEDPHKAEEVIPLFLRIVRGLRQLHQSGLFHRELSPAKIRIDTEPAQFETSEAPPTEGTLLITDARYSAPELFVANTAPSVESHILSDIYILGFIFYELLAGTRKLDEQVAEIVQKRTGLGWMVWHTDPLQKLQPLEKVVDDCHKALSELIEAMLEKDSSKRIRSFDEVESKLEHLSLRLEKTAEFVIPAPSPGPSKKSAKRRPWIAVFAVGISLLIVAVLWWLWRQPFIQPLVLPTQTGPMVLIHRGDSAAGYGPGYYIDQFEVSNQAYSEYCRRSKHAPPENPPWDPSYSTKGDYPVVDVTWDDADAFCKFAGKRLPTEAEWQGAARGPDDPAVVWGNWTLPGLANLKGAGLQSPSPVGSFPADVSGFGVMDLAGNVQEWVADDNQSSPGRPAANREPESRPVRGGSFASLPENLSPAWRGSLPRAALESGSIGFRCAADVSIARKRKP